MKLASFLTLVVNILSATFNFHNVLVLDSQTPLQKTIAVAGFMIGLIMTLWMIIKFINQWLKSPPLASSAP